MDEFVSQDIVTGLAKARARPVGRKRRLRLQVGESVFPVLDVWKGGFSVSKEDCPNLRGFVELYDGTRHIASCLVVCAKQDDDVMRYEYKRVTRAQMEGAKDFVVDLTAPTGYLSGPSSR